MTLPFHLSDLNFNSTVNCETSKRVIVVSSKTKINYPMNLMQKQKQCVKQ